MNLRTLLCAGLILASSFLAPVDPAAAAIPCQLADPLPPTASVRNPDEEIELEPVDALDALQGEAPVDRSGATRVRPGDEKRLSPVNETQNFLRCLGYQMDATLVDNTTPGYRMSHLGFVDTPAEHRAFTLTDTHVYQEQIGQPLQLPDGRLVIDFRGIINEHLVIGELVFEEYFDRLYVDDSYLFTVQPNIGEQHEVIVSGLTNPEGVTVHSGDTVAFTIEIEDAGEIQITSDDTGTAVFRGNAMGPGYVGGSAIDTFIVLEVEPGAYTATISLRENETTLTVPIVVEP